MNNDNEILAKAIKNRFHESVDALDGATLSRIRQARTAALEKSAPANRGFLQWFPVGAMASLLLAFAIYNLVPQKTVEEQTFIDELDIISDLDLYENLEFYEWLEQHELPS